MREDQAEFHSINDAIRAAAVLRERSKRSNEIPGLSATLDELYEFVGLVRTCLDEHDAANGFLTGVKQPDNPTTTRIRVALDALPRPSRIKLNLPADWMGHHTADDLGPEPADPRPSADLIGKATRYLNRHFPDDGESPRVTWQEHDAEVHALVEMLRPATADSSSPAQPGDPTVRHVVAWMRATYPMNQHAREWADEIDRVFLRGGR